MDWWRRCGRAWWRRYDPAWRTSDPACAPRAAVSPVVRRRAVRAARAAHGDRYRSDRGRPRVASPGGHPRSCRRACGPWRILGSEATEGKPRPLIGGPAMIASQSRKFHSFAWSAMTMAAQKTASSAVRRLPNREAALDGLYKDIAAKSMFPFRATSTDVEHDEIKQLMGTQKA